MIQEDKELLLKDLCSRLPYGVKVKSSRRRSLVTLSLDVMTDFHLGCSVKPYLRHGDTQNILLDWLTSLKERLI